MTRRQFCRELAWSAGFALGALAVAVVGRPQPLAILVAGVGWLTAAIIAFRALEARQGPPPGVPIPDDEPVVERRATLSATYPEDLTDD